LLERIRICGFKSLEDLDVRLEPLTVLFGLNASGKSNFLDALQLLSGLATARKLQDAFLPPYRGEPLQTCSFGPGGLEDLLTQERATFSLEADVLLSDAVVAEVDRRIQQVRGSPSVDPAAATAERSGNSAVRERRLRYRVEIEIIPRTGVLRVVDEYLAALTPSGEPTGKRRPFLEHVGDRLHLRREGQAHPTYHERYLDHTLLSTRLFEPHYPHMAAMRAELESWLFFYFEPRERMRAATAVREVTHVGLMGEELPAFLNTLRAQNPRQLQAVERALRMVVPSAEEVRVEVDRLGRVQLGIQEAGRVVPAALLSEGTLRVLGLVSLSGAQPPPAVLCFEEPENGVHPRRISLIARFVEELAASGHTQVIVTTHSPQFLDYVPIKAVYQCRRVQGHTEISSDLWGGLFRPSEPADGSEDEDELLLSERVMRGDLDA